MTTIAQNNQGSQVLSHFFHYDHFTYSAVLEHPDGSMQPFANAPNFDKDLCFVLRSRHGIAEPPPGSIPVVSADIPSGSTLLYILPGMFDIAPQARDQERVAHVIHNPDIKPGPQHLSDIAMIVISHPYPPRDPPQDIPDQVPDRKRHLHLVKPKLPPKPKRRKTRTPPKDVVDEGHRLSLWPCWLKIYRELYKHSHFGPLQDVPHYPRNTLRKGRYYFCGIDYLAGLCGLTERTVRRILHPLEAASLIYKRYHGRVGRGCHIYELPVNLRHVYKWRRDPGRKK